MAYLQLSPAYDDAAREAAERGWIVESVPGQHLGLVARAGEVADRIDHLATAAGTRARP